jgi:tetratricopeptide (TPR) repeat protein
MTIDPTLLLILIACAFILVFGALSFMRHEGLSVRFVLEVLVVTAVLVGISYLVKKPLSPFLFLILLYLITMRSRLMVDVANLFAERGRYKPAFRLYQLSLAWWPDASTRLIVLTNRGAAELLSGQTEVAIQTLEGILAEQNRPRLGIKYEAASHYNLGLTYERKGERAKAIQQFHQVVELLPGSAYGQAAAAALQRWKEKTSGD